jgi:hypothetical protein
MKILTLVVFSLLALSVQSCDQWPPGHGGNGHGNTTNSVVGTWTWIQSEGGIYHHIRTPATSGFQAKLMFSADKKYILEQSNSEGDQGEYTFGTFQNRETIRLTTSLNRIPLYSDALPIDENFLEFRGKDTMVLSGIGADMFSYTYVRAR